MTSRALVVSVAVLFAGVVGGCSDKPAPTSQAPPVTTARVMMTSGGKRTLCTYWVTNADYTAFEIRAQWTVPGGDPHKCLGGAARVAALARGRSFAAGVRPLEDASRPSQAVVAGGVGPNGEAANDQAYVYDGPTDSWRGLAMSVPRSGHTVTALDDGRALIVGGWDGTLPVSGLPSAEILDPGAMVIIGTGPLHEGRLNHAASLLADGRVLVSGGTLTTALSTAEIFDPATGEFTPTGSMSAPRTDHLSVTLGDGRVLICGSNANRAAEAYDPATGAFAFVANMRHEHGAGATATLLASGRVLICGGFDSNMGYVATAAAELFDPSTNTFTPVDDLTVARRQHVAVFLENGTVLIAGGITDVGDTVASAEIFDPGTNGFVPAPAMPLPGAEQAAVLLSAK